MIRAVLVDIGNTLQLEEGTRPDNVDALHKLRDAGVAVKFIMHSTKINRRMLKKKLTNMGFKIEESDIHTSLSVARDIIEDRKLRPYLFVSREGMEDFHGVECPKDQTPDCVVIGLAPTEFNYERMNEAFNCLMEGGSLIAVSTAKYTRRNTETMLGPGCFVRGLEYSASCEAEIIGKPSKVFFRTVVGDFKPKEVIMIGDDVYDIEGAMEAGLQGCFIKTSKSVDVKKMYPRPTMVVESFLAGVEAIYKQYGRH